MRLDVTTAAVTQRQAGGRRSTVRLDKPHGRARPDGYKQFVNPPEASVVRRIFEDYADGVSKSSFCL